MASIDIIKEFLNDASNSEVFLGDEKVKIGFSTKIGGEFVYKNPNTDLTLEIKDLASFNKTFNDYFKQYVSKRDKPAFLGPENYKKIFMTYLLANASTSDFTKPEDYINKMNDFLHDDTFKAFDGSKRIPLNGIFENKLLRIKNEPQSIKMETPFKMTFSIISADGSLEYRLPEISYGIRKDNGKKVCYIYSIFNNTKIKKLNTKGTYPIYEEKSPETPEEIKFKKDIARKLFKLNKGVSDIENPEYFESEDDYYSENITDVAMSKVLSTYIFVNMLKDKVDLIKTVPYLPLRYDNRNNYANGNEALINRNNNIQTSCTDEFIRTFRRVMEHTSFLDIESYPYELDEYLTLSLRNKKEALENDVTDSFKSL